MYDTIIRKLREREKPLDIILSGVGFMALGFLSNLKNVPSMRVVLVISRRPEDAKKTLKEYGLEDIRVTSDLNEIETTQADAFLEMTGTVAYGTELALKALNSGKHLITMNPELQATVGTELKKLADAKNLIITDVYGDQPGSLSRLINYAKIMGFKVLVAGNMKRFMNHYATQAEMKPWADDKGLAVRQTTSFTDGSKQSIEMTLVSNYFGMSLLRQGMKGAQIEDIREVLGAFENDSFSETGVVDFAIGKTLFPGIFAIVEHKDPNQKKYLRYLNMGEGPRYVLFEPYHLCHLEVAITVANVLLFNQPTINNGLSPVAKTVAIAKRDLRVGETLDGIGGDLARGDIISVSEDDNYLTMGISDGAILKNSVRKDQIIKFSDVTLPSNPATKLLGLV